MCFSPTSRARTLVERATREIVARVCGGRAMCFYCGRRLYLHDDLDAITLNSTLVLCPPITLWPRVERRGKLPPDVEEMVATLEHAV
jgi:hypothetical protein